MTASDEKAELGKRVVHIITGLSTGGAKRALHILLAGGQHSHNGHRGIAVLSLRDEGTYGARIMKLGFPVYTLGMKRGVLGPGEIMRLRKLVQSLRPDIIQGWMYHGNLAASVAARFALGIPDVAWNIRQSLYVLKAEKPLTPQVIRVNRSLSGRAAVIIYNSRLSRSQHEAFGFVGSRATVIPNGFDLEQLRPDPETGAAVRHEMGLPADALVVGHVACFHPMKDHASFLRVAVRVARENPLARRFLLVGREVSLDNPALAGIVPRDLMGRFVFAGERHDPHRFM